MKLFFKKFLSYILILMLIFILVFFSYKYSIKFSHNQSFNLNSNDNIEKYAQSQEIKIDKEEWTISIPRINLENAPISYGTDSNVLNKYVGHFENTSEFSGNVGLAAHNRGYEVNYFSNIYKLECGDSIFYKFNGKTREYKVILKKEIDSYDWSYLKETNDDRITLITCIDNKPNFRLCIQGILK